MTINSYLAVHAAERADAKVQIARLINRHALTPPFHISDRAAYGVIFEGMTVARLQPWRDGRYAHLRTALSPDRLHVIEQLVRDAPPGGVCYECGVYTGGVTRMMLDAGRVVVAFDTFTGIAGATPADLHANGEYDGGDVSEYIRGAIIVKGEVPGTFAERDDSIAFVHLDMDVYAPTAAALRYVWPRLLPGGAVVLDDYGFWTTPGIRKAADEFALCRRRLHLSTGQMVMFK